MAPSSSMHARKRARMLPAYTTRSTGEGPPTNMRKRTQPLICTLTDCQRQSKARGLCNMHWKRQRFHGDVRHQKPAPRDFWSCVDVGEPDECWPWTKSTFGRNVKYGRLKWRGQTVSAHRVAWMLTNGELPLLPDADFRGTCVLHRCDFGLCCNPKHLFVGTNHDNVLDRVAKGRTRNGYGNGGTASHCRRGHPRTPENLYTSRTRSGACRICARDSAREQRRRASPSTTQEASVC